MEPKDFNRWEALASFIAGAVMAAREQGLTWNDIYGALLLSLMRASRALAAFFGLVALQAENTYYQEIAL